VPIDVQGSFLLRDLRAGPQRLTVVHGSVRLSRMVELGAEPAAVSGVEFDVCPSNVGSHGVK
jgi:hypothetical protein